MAYTFIISDESINSYGTRVLTEGIDLSDFLKNPIMLWNHFRNWKGTEDEVLPIGKWVNIRKEKGKLLADAEFDKEDAFAQKIESKVKQGIINCASIGIRVLSTSEDKAYLLQGQTRPTIIQSKLRETSVVDIPANKNAVKLLDDNDKELNLNDKEDNFLLPLLSESNNENQDMDLKEFALQLNLGENATKEEILSAMQAQSRENVSLKQQNSDLESQLQGYKDKELADNKAKAKSLVDGAIKEGKLSEDARKEFTELAESNYELAEKTIAGIRVDLSEFAGGGNGGGSSSKFADKSWDQLDRAGTLQELKDTDLELYKEKYQEKFGKELK